MIVARLEVEILGVGVETGVHTPTIPTNDLPSPILKKDACHIIKS